MKETALSTTRPGRGPAAPIEPHVEKARRAVITESTEEKQLKAIVPVRYHRDTNDIKSMSADNIPVKYLIIEALDDLFKKYEQGKGHFDVEDKEELRRRLESLK
ncbi:hypothetical protein [Pseudomonas viridiflava]|uniref:hypothetical protein n=1 Tax=Pseudomonas viridiflava TaxID=33069 RepID=UPI000F06F5C6|nr:hypothetical protein [Pseudomonas viridiflava]